MKKLSNSNSVVFALTLGLLVNILVTVFIAVVLAFMVVGEKIGPDAVVYGRVIGTVMAALAGCALATKLYGKQILLISFLSGALYMFCLLAMTAIFFGGQYKGMIAGAIAVFGACSATVLLQMRGSQGRKRPRIRYKTH